MYYCFQQFAAERVMTSKHNSEITKKDKEIDFLKATVKKLEVSYWTPIS
jgi:hypothetical protein